MAENSLSETGPLALVGFGRCIVYSEVNVGMLAAGIGFLSYALAKPGVSEPEGPLYPNGYPVG